MVAVLPTERSISLSRHDDAFMCSQLGLKARVARGAMTNSSHLEINAAQWHRTRLEQLLEHPTGASQCDGLLLLGFW